jgi:hypothetical protein
MAWGGKRVPCPGKKLGRPQQLPDQLRHRLRLEFAIAMRRISSYAGTPRQRAVANAVIAELRRVTE